MQQSKAYGLWQLAAPAQWQQLLHPQSLQPCFVRKHAERHAVRAVSGDHFVPSMNKLHILRWAWKKESYQEQFAVQAIISFRLKK